MWRAIIRELKIGDIVVVFMTLCLVGVWMSQTFTATVQQLEARVFVRNEQVLTIPLSELTKTIQYVVEGVNGEVVIEAQYNQIRVLQERSPKHLCSIQGWVSNSVFPIVCLPNQTVIEVSVKGGTSADDFDSVVR
ncbi:MAG: NusG domain II-containing protein [Culicoidibacterales bacterium]